MCSLRLLKDHYFEEIVELILSFHHHEFIALKENKWGNTLEQMNTHDIFPIKKFFIYIENRGIELSFGQELLDVIFEYARQQGATTIFLDTPSIAKRSLQFFEKNGLVAITKQDLPIRYDYPDRNSLFHRFDFI
jgi:GNAT superfamily N-acetyltransferase